MDLIKRFLPFVCILMACLGAINHANADASKKTTGSNVDALLPNQMAFLNLPEETRQEFQKHFFEANRLFQQKRILESLEELEIASKIFPDAPEIHNLRGSCQVEIRAFDKALVEFQKALKLAANSPSLLFNLGEVYFVTHEWQKAIDTFDELLRNLPPNETNLGRLAEFKILLCMNRLGLKNDVIALAEKYEFMDDSPYYYYAQAALAYEAKDHKRAEQWLASAYRIFRNSAMLSAWQDTMIEYGYIKSFYGEDALTEESQ